MQQENFSLTPEQQRELQSLAEMPDEEIDFSDIPETLDWSGAERGRFYQAHQSLNARPETAAGAHTLVFSDTTERGLETRIVRILTAGHLDAHYDNWIVGETTDYDRGNCVDLNQLSAFLHTTQPDAAAALALDDDNPTRRQFLARLKREVRNRGIIDVLRTGINHHQHHVDLFYGTPTPGNTAAEARYAQNRFSVTRQLRYSNDEKQRALDLALFINGLPIATFELKNNLTKQTVSDAVQQYRNTRGPREDLFHVGRCAVHFAVDEQEVMFCTKLSGKDSVFLPFNKGGANGAAGNPVNPNGLKTDYLWQEVLAPHSLTDIIENYTQKVGDEQIWPRYHQLQVVRNLLYDAAARDVGQRYLIQHSAGSGKSKSIAWLCRQLIGLKKDGQDLFDTVIVVTDRILLNGQISDEIQQFTQVRSTFARAETSAQLRQYIAEGKKIISTTVQKFPVIYRTMGSEHRGRKFAVIIDEAHSSQGGRAASAMSASLSATNSQPGDDDENTFEDQINRLIDSHRMLTNASYFAFTATPKNKTLELFGDASPPADGIVKHLPFHTYSMKQAIQEGFILDVLGSHTTVNSYFGLVKAIDDDPEFDSKRAQSRLRRYVEGHKYAVARKAEIMVDHFHEAVFRPRKIDGQARAMVVTDGVDRAIEYHNAISAYIKENNYPYRSIIAFSGERQYQGRTVSEASLNDFPSRQIPDKIKEDPYRILICADKFQTGYDEPLLHTMYVDKTLAGIKAVQTLSRLNRAFPNKSDTFVLDFMNSSDVIRESFADYYRTTMLADETDPNKLHDLKATLDKRQVYAPPQLDELVEGYLNGRDRGELDPIADECLEPYKALSEDAQVEFKGSAKAFVRLYAFLCQILPYANRDWEKLSIFLNFLIPRLPAPVDDDLSVGILETVNMDSYRAEKQATQRLLVGDEGGEVDPVPAGGGGQRHEPVLAPLTQIVAIFNDTWSTDFTDADKVAELIRTLPDRVVADTAYQNARRNSDPQNARIEHDAALRRLITSMVRTNTELFRAYTENPDFRSWLSDQMFWLTYLDDNSA